MRKIALIVKVGAASRERIEAEWNRGYISTPRKAEAAEMRNNIYTDPVLTSAGPRNSATTQN